MKRRLLIICLAALSCPVSLLHSQNPDMPLNINTATREELSMLPFLTERQIEDIQAYIYMHGPMLTLGELQLTGSLDYATRRLLREFVYAGDIPPQKEKLRLDDIIRHGRNEIVARCDIPLYMRDGFRYHSPQELARYSNRAYNGGRLSYSLRYSFNWHNRIRAGFTADKDAGEKGVDYCSPYLYMKDVGVIKELALGNFKAQFGYGLLLGGGFSAGKNMALTSVNRRTQGLKPHASTQEYGYLRGAGAAVGWGHTTFTLIAANTPLDATLKGDSAISSFKEDGYHRTPLECSKRHNVKLGTMALNARYSFRGLKLGCTFLAESLSVPYLGHDRYAGISADVSVSRGRYALASELSLSDSRIALIASQTLRLSNVWSLNMLMRHYSPDYFALHSNALSEGGKVQNETGLLTGFTHGSRNLSVSGYADFFVHPEPRYEASARSNGMDLKAEVEWIAGRRDDLYATARFKSKQKDCKYTGQLEYCWTGRYRLKWTHRLRSGAEFKTQFFYTRYDFIAQPISNGYALSADYSRSMWKDRLEMSLNGAVFSTDSYDSRISVYEEGLRYSYNFISLYGKGCRAAMNLKWKITQGMQLNLKAAGIYYLDRDEISSSQQRIDSNHKEDISVQFIAKF